MTCFKAFVKHCLCFFAFLTWLLGSVVIVLTLWVLSTSPNMKKLFTGTLPVTYVALGLGLLLFTNGLLGWMGSYKRGSCMLRMFLFLCVLTIAAEIGGIISLSILRAKVTDIVDQSWKELNQRSRNLIQRQFECCGLDGPSYYAHSSDTIDSSCYHSISGEPSLNNTTEYGKSINERGCREVVTNWIFENKVTWVAAFGGFLLFQVITVLLSVSAVNHLKDRSSSIASLEERTYM